MTPITATVLFTQEAANAGESKVHLPSVTGLVNRPLQVIQPSKSSRVMLDRPVRFTESPKIRPICQEFGLAKLTGYRTGLAVEKAYRSFNGDF